MTADEVSTFC